MYPNLPNFSCSSSDCSWSKELFKAEAHQILPEVHHVTGRLSGLSVISINHAIAGQICYDDVIDDFASRQARKVRV